jgi:hypothetical protein
MFYMNDEPLTFKRNSLITKVFYANGIMMFLLCMLHLAQGQTASAIINFITVFIWIAGAMMYSSRPYCAITDSGIEIRAGLKCFTKTCTWTDVVDVKRINTKKFKLVTALKNDITINLFLVGKSERLRLVDVIQQKLQQTGQPAASLNAHQAGRG